MDELTRRSLIGSSMLGVRWAVTHPFTLCGNVYDASACQTANLRYFEPYAELAASFGLGIALETDFDLPDRRVYCGRMEELIALADAFGDANHIGLCYDFGHAHLQTDGLTHREKIMMAGKRIKALHVQDNHGNADEHLLPFFGNIDWQECMHALARSGYDGDLTFEVQEFGRCLPEDMKHLTASLSLDIGERLLQWYLEGLQNRADV